MNKRKIVLTGILSTTLAVALLAWAGMVIAQIVDQDDNESQSQMPEATAVITNDVVQIQGRLTDASGNPINGSRTIVTSIYNVSSGGVALCSDSDTVAVSHGLFQMDMDFCGATAFNGEQVYLGIKVGADAEMTPRKPIYAVPLAWGLRPGAVVKGADTDLFVPGIAMVKNLNTDTTRWDAQGNGGVQIFRGATAGSKTVFIPITLPGVLYGQPVTVKTATVYYRCETANTYVDRFVMNKQTDADSFVNIEDSATNLTSLVATNYSYSFSSNNVLSSSQGILGVWITISFANDTDYFQLGGIRLILSHQ